MKDIEDYISMSRMYDFKVRPGVKTFTTIDNDDQNHINSKDPGVHMDKSMK